MHAGNQAAPRTAILRGRADDGAQHSMTARLPRTRRSRVSC